MPTRDEAATTQVKIRIKEPLRAKIEADAEARGVTMNAVINDRLEGSFREDARSSDLRETFALALGADVAGFTLAIGLATRDVVKWPALGPKPGLLSNAFIFDQAAAAVRTVIESVKPLAIQRCSRAAIMCRPGRKPPRSNGARLAAMSAGRYVGKSPSIQSALDRGALRLENGSVGTRSSGLKPKSPTFSAHIRISHVS